MQLNESGAIDDAQDGHFVLEELAEDLLLNLLVVDDFDGHHLAVCYVDSFVDVAELAFSDRV